MFRWITVVATGLALSVLITLPAFAERPGAGFGDRFGGFALVGLSFTADGVGPFLGFGRAGQAAPGADIVRRVEYLGGRAAARLGEVERRFDDLVCRAVPAFGCRGN